MLKALSQRHTEPSVVGKASQRLIIGHPCVALLRAVCLCVLFAIFNELAVSPAAAEPEGRYRSYRQLPVIYIFLLYVVLINEFIKRVVTYRLHTATKQLT